jgi:parvulin-like peptidyl-prolyl isomerase
MQSLRKYFPSPGQAAAWLLIGLLLAACGPGQGETPVPPAPPSPTTQPVTPTASPSPLPPSPTPIPLAASVNGEGISLAEYQAELERARLGGEELTPELEGRVLQDLIEQTLLAQAAREAGFLLDEAGLDERLRSLSEQAGGEQALQAWLAANQYSAEAFRQALRRAAEAAWMRDQILAAAPERAEQVHARQILLYNSDDAKNVYDRLKAGTDFAALAAELDPLGAGELGWFPRGILLEPALEAAAFELQPGSFSAVIETQLGFHIIQVIERQADRPLLPDARLALQVQALATWLAERNSQSEIQILVP